MLHIIGVRHHSPACARVVEATLRRVRPRHVLIEGPCDAAALLPDLLRPHTPPIAVLSWLRAPSHQHTSWWPLCDWSPEYVALRVGAELGATVHLVDLPAWHPAFAAVTHRGADRRGDPDRPTDVWAALTARLGADNADVAWDHLFEGPGDPSAALTAFFDALRGDRPAGPRDAPREAMMAEAAAWAAADGDAVLVCGGWHAPAVRAAWPHATPRLPTPPPPDDPEARVGSLLVPFRDVRLDAFAGYDAGMPSPGWQRLVWAHGPAAAPDLALQATARALRPPPPARTADAEPLAASATARGFRPHAAAKAPSQPLAARTPGVASLSTAELIPLRATALALAHLRGRDHVQRADLLDALASTLLRDGLREEAPWRRAGPLSTDADPVLATLVELWRGDRVGRLAPGTPAPPLVDDVRAQLDAFDLQPASPARERTLDPDSAPSQLLHRLVALDIPGFRVAAAPNGRERWTLSLDDLAHLALVEAATWGGTLEEAARARLTHRLHTEPDLLPAVTVLLLARAAGLRALDAEAHAAASAAIHRSTSLHDLGFALQRLLPLHPDLLAAASDRALWVISGRTGPGEAADRAELGALASLRRAWTLFPPADPPHVLGALARVHADADAPPALRGGALVLRWWLDDTPLTALAAAVGHLGPATLGDWLAGVLAVARPRLADADALLAAVDTALQALDDEALLAALPALRMAFAWLPPVERGQIAAWAAKRHGGLGADLLHPLVDPAATARGLRLQASARALAATWSLGDPP